MNKKTPRYGRIDRIWLGSLAVAGTLLSTLLATGAFDLSILVSGILCVGLTAVGRREGYLIGLYNSLSYAVLAYGNGLYGEVYLNLLFFVPTGVVGYVLWQRHATADRTVAMRQLGWTQRGLVALACAVLTAGLGLLLRLNPNQNTPFIDASTNVLSVMATFLMMGRFKEQWILYIVLNGMSILMWALRSKAGGESGGLMVLMWSLFLLNALFGSWRWHMGATRTADPRVRSRTGEAACGAA